MTAPRLTRYGTLRTDGRELEVVRDGSSCIALLVALDESETARAMHETRVRITIEPASAPEQAAPVEAPPAHGSPLDYLAQAKRLIESDELGAYVTGTGQEFPDSEDAARLLSIMNSAHLAILSTQRGPR